MNETSVVGAYGELVASRTVAEDPIQRRAAMRLDELAERVRRKHSIVERVKRAFEGKPHIDASLGIYLAGRPGRGKTMLMDLFYNSIGHLKKRRVHFNAFMDDVHGRIHQLRKGLDSSDIVAPVALEIAAEAKVLCLDEFQVNDIADAMLLGRLFEALLAKGVFAVLTSNTEPRLLYENGLNRALFVPFIEMIQERFEIISLDEGKDYRLQRITGETSYIHPLGEEADRHLQRLWRELTDGEPGRPVEIAVKGRILKVPVSAHGVARFSFHDLCERPLGAVDYMALARRFDTIFIEHVPELSRRRRDATRRMITLIDILHDAGVRLVISAAASPSQLAPGLQDFARTASRLHEMQSSDYWQREIKRPTT